ncbi:methyl-accepting chemotaxis protein [Cytobacillus spongiae]|uniref:methyl-accepting chemotaxis protein n=1 Tax=Cytobacillus spongiae TaxID=2901381 RepID=UPI001F267007|nr:methyl-accepting chemotaxis protein [Cytobacillus spongiae]UII55944.1 methyl-accepting chemotaxis protein [Cytobacillus spongiae]
MVNSVKKKLIILFISLLVVTLSVVGLLINYQMKKQIEKDVVAQSKVIVGEMTLSLELFLEQYSNSIHQIALSDSAAQYVLRAVEDPEYANNYVWARLKSDFESYSELYNEISSIYVAAPNKELQIYPKADLPDGFDPTSRGWYKGAEENPDKVVWSEPYMDQASEELILTASRAITAGSKVIGVVGIDIKLTDFATMLSKMELGYQGKPIVISKDGTAIVHPTKQNKKIADLDYVKSMAKQTKGIENYREGSADKLLIYQTLPGAEWKVGATYSDKHLMASAQKIKLALLLISVVALIVASGITYYVSVRITKPIADLKKAVNQVAEGDLQVNITARSKDEIGELANHFNHMVQNIRSLLQVVNQSVANVKESAESLSAVSEETNAASEEMASAINEIALGAAQSASEAETAHHQSNQLSDNINIVSKQTEKMTTLADQADEVNQLGLSNITELLGSFGQSKQYLSSMEAVIVDLEEKIKQIEHVMTTITEISSQTNLLALNASIEAARAGEHGKGFAVVAEEVRKLAEQSVRATDEVKSTITVIQGGAAKAVESMNHTKKNFDEQSGVVKGTEESFQTISHVVESMKQSILDIHQEMASISIQKDDVVTGVQSIAAMAEQAAASCEEVSASTDEQMKAFESVALASERLAELSYELEAVVNKFKI